jgi:hypothetical protein
VTWVLLIVRLSGEPSRHRVAVWRELRRAGAVPVAPGVWTFPASPVFSAAAERATDLARRGGGDVAVLDVSHRDRSGDGGNGGGDEDGMLREVFTQARVQEWAEFVDDCGKFEAEIAKEVRTGKFTLAELEEEEQSLDRLRRWYRDLKTRDVLALPEAADAERRLKACGEVLDDYADRVYHAVHSHDSDADLPVGAGGGDE